MNTSSTPTLPLRTVLVTGASGHLGRSVVELLLARGDVRVVAGTRTPQKLADLTARGVPVRRVDFDDAASLASAFQDVARVLLISTDDVTEHGRRFRQHKAAIEAMARARVQHVVYTSLVAPDATSPIALAYDHRETEAALDSSDLGFTVLRNNLYAENLLGSLPQAIATGSLVAAAGTGGASYVTREDCARAAAAALAATFDGRRTLDITGPEVVTHEALAQLAGDIAGKPVRYQPVDSAALRQGLSAAGLPPVIVELIAGFDEAIAEGRMAVHSTAVQELTASPGTTIAAFLRATLPQVLAAKPHAA